MIPNVLPFLVTPTINHTSCLWSLAKQKMKLLWKQRHLGKIKDKEGFVWLLFDNIYIKNLIEFSTLPFFQQNTSWETNHFVFVTLYNRPKLVINHDWHFSNTLFRLSFAQGQLYVYVCMNEYVWVCMCVRMYACMYVRMYKPRKISGASFIGQSAS